VIWVEFALTGLVAGFLAGYLGIGGGLVLVPVLTWLLSRDPATTSHATHMAVATSLATMLLTSLSSILAHHRRDAVSWPLTGQLAPGLLVGSLCGALLADQLSSKTLAAVFGVFALAVGLHMLAGRKPAAHAGPAGRTKNSIAGVIFGAISSVVGIGGGSLTAPWFMWHGSRPQQAIATAAACGYPIAVMGSLSYAWLGRDAVSAPWSLGYVSLPAFVGISAFTVLAAPLGAAAVHRTPPERVRRLFGVFLMLIALKMVGGWIMG
jgi:uncharacterized membrane protein YfcA